MSSILFYQEQLEKSGFFLILCFQFLFFADYISFSAHTDFEQTSEFIRILKPPHIVSACITRLNNYAIFLGKINFLVTINRHFAVVYM